MIVQWCVKGMGLDSDAEARALIDDGTGLISNWWRDAGLINQLDRREQLTLDNLDRHVNHFTEFDPATGRRFSEITPYISLSAGVVERLPMLATNRAYRARATALRFGLNFGTRRTAYLYNCWLLVAPDRAVEVEGVAEEIRDLNTYRSYSAFQAEGEITAKIAVPSNQIESVERWDWDPGAATLSQSWRHLNPRFTAPTVLSNIRDVI